MPIKLTKLHPQDQIAVYCRMSDDTLGKLKRNYPCLLDILEPISVMRGVFQNFKDQLTTMTQLLVYDDEMVYFALLGDQEETVRQNVTNVFACLSCSLLERVYTQEQIDIKSKRDFVQCIAIADALLADHSTLALKVFRRPLREMIRAVLPRLSGTDSMYTAAKRLYYSNPTHRVLPVFTTLVFEMSPPNPDFRQNKNLNMVKKKHVEDVEKGLMLIETVDYNGRSHEIKMKEAALEDILDNITPSGDEFYPAFKQRMGGEVEGEDVLIEFGHLTYPENFTLDGVNSSVVRRILARFVRERWKSDALEMLLDKLRSDLNFI